MWNGSELEKVRTVQVQVQIAPYTLAYVIDMLSESRQPRDANFFLRRPRDPFLNELVVSKSDHLILKNWWQERQKWICIRFFQHLCGLKYCGSGLRASSSIRTHVNSVVSPRQHHALKQSSLHCSGLFFRVCQKLLLVALNLVKKTLNTSNTCLHTRTSLK